MSAEEHLSGPEAMERVVESLEESADALEPVAAFFETLDLALQMHRDTERASFTSFVSAYKQAARQLEKEAEESARTES